MLISIMKPKVVFFFLLLCFCSLALFLSSYLHYDFMRSDPLSYWQDSLAWKTPFHPFHVPGYPLLIAFARAITLGILAPVNLMMVVNLCAYIGSAYLIFRILTVGGVSEEPALIGVLLFGLWPFVGLTYAVDPVADITAILLFLCGYYSLLLGRKKQAGFILGLALITHKVMWLFVFGLVITDWLLTKDIFTKRNFWFLLFLLSPIAILWFFGAIYHGSITWLFISNLKVEVASKSALPLLDGLIGTFINGDLKGILKGGILTVFASIALICAITVYRSKYKHFEYGLAISLSILMLFLLLNQGEIWAAMRFSRLLALPLISVINPFIVTGARKWTTPVTLLTLLLFLMSQFIYSWYMAIYYFG